MGIGGSNGTFQDGLGCDCEAGWRFAQSEKVGYGQRRKSRGGGGCPLTPPPRDFPSVNIRAKLGDFRARSLGFGAASLFFFVCLLVSSIRQQYARISTSNIVTQ